MNASTELVPVTAIKSFDFAPGLPLRTITKDGGPWFIAADVCKALDIGNPSQAVQALDEDQQGITSTDTNRGSSPVDILASMRRCPKFDVCSAPVCPLDPQWRSRPMLSSERACTWLLEMVKEGSGTQYLPEVIRQEVSKVLPQVLSLVGLAPLRAKLKRAALTGSRRAHVPRVRA